VSSDFGAVLRVRLQNAAAGPLTLQPLQLDLDATALQIRAVTVNDFAYANYQVTDLVGTQQLPEPHLRIVFPNLTLAAASDTEIAFAYNDAVAPTIASLAFNRGSPAGKPIPSATPVPIVAGDTTFARAVVKDNGALHSLILRFQLGEQVVEVPFEEDVGHADTYVVSMPRPARTGTGTVQVVAVDAAGNLQASEPLPVEVRSALFSGGSLVLFVFSGTLFVAVVVIWIKMRHKDRLRR
jgi:hypothetical protein